MSKKWKLARTESAVAALVAAALMEPLGSGAALAQVNAPVSQAGSSASGQVEEVVVTAQRRSETAQSIPISITAITAKQLENTGIQTTQDLVVATPGLTMTQTLNGVTPYIRGVGTQAATTEGAVAFYVDNVYYASTQGAIFELNNVDRVEVLKGPQGTLFGRNATGGLINVITRDPSHTPEIKGSIGYGNYNTLSGNLYATAGLTKNIAMDFAFSGSDQQDGWGKNHYLGNQVNLTQDWAARSKLKVDISDNTDVLFAFDYSRWRSDIGLTRQALPGTKAVGGVLPVGSIYDSNSNLPSIYNYPNYGGYPVSGDPESWQGGGSLKVEHRFSDSLSLTSLSAFRWVDSRGYLNTDLVPAHIGDVFLHSINTRSFQQDLLLNGTTHRLKWTVGLNYFHSVGGYDPVWISSPNPAVDVVRYAQNYLNSYAGFGQGTYDLDERTHLTLGLRYTVDQLRAEANDYAGLGHGATPVGTLLASTKFSPDNRTHQQWDALTWRAALDHKFTDAFMGYMSYSKGYKSGVYNPAAPPTNTAAPPVGDAVQPETLYAYEIGIKSEFFRHQLRANGALFYYDYRNIQLLQQAPNGVASTLFNAKKASVYGGEIELVYVPRIPKGDLQISGSATLLDPQYGNFPNAPVTHTLPGGGDVTTNCAVNPAGCNATGNQMVRAPRISSSVGVHYSIPVSDALEAAFDVNWQHSGKYYFEVDNRLFQPAYDVVNSQIALGRQNDAWRIRVWVRNLSDAKYYVAQQSSNFGDGEMPAAPRTFGANLDFKFGG